MATSGAPSEVGGSASQGLKWASDENVDGAITRGLRRRGVDVVRIQDYPEVYEQPDEIVLAWTTAEDRILVTGDRRSMESARQIQFAITGKCSPIVYLRRSANVGEVIDEIELLDQCSSPDDWACGVLWIP